MTIVIAIPLFSAAKDDLATHLGTETVLSVPETLDQSGPFWEKPDDKKGKSGAQEGRDKKPEGKPGRRDPADAGDLLSENKGGGQGEVVGPLSNEMYAYFGIERISLVPTVAVINAITILNQSDLKAVTSNGIVQIGFWTATGVFVLKTAKFVGTKALGVVGFLASASAVGAATLSDYYMTPEGFSEFLREPLEYQLNFLSYNPELVGKIMLLSAEVSEK